MNITTNDIERVVRDVLAEIGGDGKCPVTAVAGESTAPPPRPQSRDVDSQHEGDLVLTARVVSINELHGRLDSVRRVVVRRRAIVTPAVRDELLRRGIALEYSDSDEDAKPAVRLALIVAATEFDPAALAAALDRDGFRVDRSESDCLIAAVDELAGEVSRPDTLGVLLTSHTAAGLCLANRLAGVRAIIGTNTAETTRSAAAVGANMLVVNPAAGGFFQLKQIVAEFARGGVRPCPTVFRERLDK